MSSYVAYLRQIIDMKYNVQKMFLQCNNGSICDELQPSKKDNPNQNIGFGHPLSEIWRPYCNSKTAVGKCLYFIQIVLFTLIHVKIVFIHHLFQLWCQSLKNAQLIALAFDFVCWYLLARFQYDRCSIQQLLVGLQLGRTQLDRLQSHAIINRIIVYTNPVGLFTLVIKLADGLFSANRTKKTDKRSNRKTEERRQTIRNSMLSK